MILLWIQIGLTIALVGSATYLQLFVFRKRSRHRGELILPFSHLGGRLVDLSSHPFLSDELVVPEEHVWEQIDGMRGLRAIFTNAEIIVDLLDYLKEHCGACLSGANDIGALRAKAVRIRLMAVIAIAASLFWEPPSNTLLIEVTVAKAYVSLRARTYRATVWYCPQLRSELAIGLSSRSDCQVHVRQTKPRPGP